MGGVWKAHSLANQYPLRKLAWNKKDRKTLQGILEAKLLTEKQR